MNLKIFTDNIEQKAMDQINTLMAQPAFADCKVRIMPDVHAGAGCVIGFTADLGDKVIPNIVGVDIGCGMLTVELGKIDINYEKLDDVIHEHIPYGMSVHDTVPEDFHMHFDLRCLHCYDGLKNTDWLEKSLGTLGGGNHFIEIDADDEGNKYLVIHTGSRNLGKQVADYWQKVAIEEHSGKVTPEMRNQLIRQLKDEHMEQEIADALRELQKQYHQDDCPKELCWLEGRNREMYLDDMRFCQLFAIYNREKIALTIMDEMEWTMRGGFETIHNYISDDNMVRKGAISAKKGERVLIPMNMRDGCIIGIGKGNVDWNCSAPHGAGRIMSRMEAKRKVTLDEYRQSMKDVWTTSVGLDTIDESPMAYKPMDEILRYVGQTIDVEKIIKPVYNFKAGE